jgi:hypothetical protein
MAELKLFTVDENGAPIEIDLTEHLGVIHNALADAVLSAEDHAATMEQKGYSSMALSTHISATRINAVMMVLRKAIFV